MAAYLILSKDGPMVDSDPQDGDDVRSVPLRLDARAQACLDRLLGLTSFEVCHLFGALVAEGVRLGGRSPGVIRPPV